MNAPAELTNVIHILRAINDRPYGWIRTKTQGLPQNVLKYDGYAIVGAAMRRPLVYNDRYCTQAGAESAPLQ